MKTVNDEIEGGGSNVYDAIYEALNPHKRALMFRAWNFFFKDPATAMESEFVDLMTTIEEVVYNKKLFAD